MKKRILTLLALCLALVLCLVGCGSDQQAYIDELLAKIDALEQQVACLSGQHSILGDVDYSWERGCCTATGLCAHCQEQFSETVEVTVSAQTVTAAFETEGFATVTQDACHQEENTWLVWTAEALRTAVDNAAQSNGTVRLMMDMELVDDGTELAGDGHGLTVTGSMTLDLNGCALSSCQSEVIAISTGEDALVTILDEAEARGNLMGLEGSDCVISVLSCGELRLEGCVMQIEGESVCAVFVSSGALVADDAWIVVFAGEGQTGSTSVACGIRSAGDVTLCDSYVEVYNGDMGYGVVSTGGQVVLEGGGVTMLGSSAAYGLFASGGDVALSGADLTVDASVPCGIYATGYVTLEESYVQAWGEGSTYGVYTTGGLDMASGTVEVCGGMGIGVYADQAEVMLSDGQVLASGPKAVGILANCSALTVAGGTVEATISDSEDDGYADGIEIWASEADASALTITGGKISGESDALYFNLTVDSQGNTHMPEIEITGGTISGEIYLAGLNYTLEQFLEALG